MDILHDYLVLLDDFDDVICCRSSLMVPMKGFKHSSQGGFGMYNCSACRKPWYKDERGFWRFRKEFRSRAKTAS